ncbi:hypothetical protein TNIN_262221 [Trichonephila inaurata madagascariensis]|uniref:Gag protein n=1 Tax=Trichonephila inaurata madagascariensis TaxID=2747483 RepID=A0A8X7BUK4_9ARAC|nr:hypothetical protein TNIN_262221 [Trichonephila inaurata madagascariensis]
MRIFLDGIAKKRYENNEDSFTSWTSNVRRASDRLKSRAQQPGECIQSYIQDVLELCKQAELNTSEEDKVSHLMMKAAQPQHQAAGTAIRLGYHKDEVDRSLATITSQPITASQQFFSSAQRPTLKTPDDHQHTPQDHQ